MDILQKTIHALSKKEIISYKIFTNRSKDDHNRKDLALFDLIKKSTKKDSHKSEALSVLYPETNNVNTYNKLKTRLLEEIDNSLVQFYFHEPDVRFVYSELSLYHTFYLKAKWEIAHYHLQKAEKKAQQISNFDLLEIIYGEFIKLSIYFGKETPSFYIKQRALNNTKLKDIRELDNALSLIIFELSKKQTFGKTTAFNLANLNNAIKALKENKSLKKNPVFKQKLFLAISQMLISKKDFSTLESYSIKTYKEFIKQQAFSKNNHDIKLQVLRYICNSLFLNQKYTEALAYCKLFYEAMLEHQAFLYEANIFFYYNALANNYSVLDTKKAVEILNEAKNNEAILNHPTHLGYVFLNLAGAYFDLKEPKLAIKNVTSICHHPVFEKLNTSFKIQIYIIDIILRIETKNLEYSKKQIDFLVKEYKKTLLQKEHKYDYDFVLMLKKTTSQVNVATDKASQKIIKTFCDKYTDEPSNSLVNYTKWATEFLINKQI